MRFRYYNSITVLSDGKLSQAASEKIGLHEDVKSIASLVINVDNQSCSEWVSCPQELRADSKSRRLMIAYDAFLIAIALVLIVGVMVCIIAFNIDFWAWGVDIEIVSGLTIFLFHFNSQVRTQTSLTTAYLTTPKSSQPCLPMPSSPLCQRWSGDGRFTKAQRGVHLAELE
jgi:hypothetical protein